LGGPTWFKVRLKNSHILLRQLFLVFRGVIFDRVAVNVFPHTRVQVFVDKLISPQFFEKGMGVDLGCDDDTCWLVWVREEGLSV
jgi:hypothetical protein